MMTTWKYSLQIEDEQVISVPKGATPLAVQVQDGIPCLWMLVDDQQRPTPRTFRMFGTGNRIEMRPGEKLSYIATFQLTAGFFVRHVFEVGRA